MANMILSVPKERAIFRYAHRSGEQPFSDEIVMTGGAADSASTFSSPICDELKITATYLEPETISRVHFSGLSIIDGLQFDLDWSGETFIQTPINGGGIYQDKTMRSTDHTRLDFEVIISGINQRQLTFDQFVLSSIDWSPVVSFNDDSAHESPKRYARQRTINHSTQRLTDPARALKLDFYSLTQAEYDDLRTIVDITSDNGYLLAELDPDLSDRYSFLADCAIVSFSSNSENKQASLQVIEKNSQ